MTSRSPMKPLGAAVVFGAALALGTTMAAAQERLPWQSDRATDYNSQSRAAPYPARPRYDAGRDSYARAPDPYNPSSPSYGTRPADPANPPRGYTEPPPRTYQPSGRPRTYEPAPRYSAPRTREPRYYDERRRTYPERRYGSAQPVEPPRYRRRRLEASPSLPDERYKTYSRNEVVDAGHRFFGSLSTGLAKAIEYVFQRSGRPNGYILGEDAGGAFVAGLRYGEGKLYTKYGRPRRVFWQGPTVGYDFGGEGSRTMVLVYNLRSSRDIYRRFGGVQGSAYLVGGVGVQYLRAGGVTLAPIRTGVGLRLGANIGYLKYTRRPTWNPF